MREDIEHFTRIIAEQFKGIYLRDLIMIILVALLFVLVIRAARLKAGKDMTMSQSLLTFMTVAYAGALLLITIFRRASGSRSGQINTYVYFGSLRGGWFSTKLAVYSILNVILFVPWGFLLELMRSKEHIAKAFLLTVLTGFLTTFFIEIVQYVTGRGVFEMTDIVTNVTGTAIGAILAFVVTKICLKYKQEK